MDSFELNKIIGAVLGTLLFVMGIGFLAEGIYHPIEDRGPDYALPEPTPVAASGDQPAVVVASIGTLLASADPAAGQSSARKCQSCHNFVEGGPNGQGPNLFGVVGRPVASHEGFQYSDAMKAHAAEVGGTWTYEALNEFLTAPKEVVQGTKMNFNGVKDDSERANIIAFLSTLSTDPVPFPPADAAPAADATATPADATATPADATATPADATAAPSIETQQTPAATDATQPGVETNTAPEPTSGDNVAPGQTTATPVETPDTTDTESGVEGTATNSNTPAGAEQPAQAPQ